MCAPIPLPKEVERYLTCQLLHEKKHISVQQEKDGKIIYEIKYVCEECYGKGK